MPGYFRRKSARLAEGDSVLRHPVEFDVSGDGNGCGLKRGEHLLYIARMRKVIGGQESHELGTGELDAVIKASAITTVIITGDKADSAAQAKYGIRELVYSAGSMYTADAQTLQARLYESKRRLMPAHGAQRGGGGGTADQWVELAPIAIRQVNVFPVQVSCLERGEVFMDGVELSRNE